MSSAVWSVHPSWARPAFNTKPIAGATTLLGGSLAVGTFNGVIPGSPGDPDYDIATEGVALGYDLLPMIPAAGGVQMHRCRTYAGTDQGNAGNETFAWNMSRAEVCRWLAQRYVERYGIFDGLHIDYWIALSAIAADQSLNAGFNGIAMTDNQYMQGMNRFVHEYRRRRTAQGKTSLVIGQQWQNDDPVASIHMRELDGRYIEQNPDLWGTNPWQTYHQGQFDTWAAATAPHLGSKSNMVIELAVRGGVDNDKPWPSNPSLQTAVIAFASTNTCFVSWGRDSHALEGWPG